MNFKKLVITALGVCALSCASFAQGYTQYATGGTAINGGTNYAIISPSSKNGGEPTVTYLNVNGLSANPITVTSYVPTNTTVAIGTNSVNVLSVSSTNGFFAGQWVVIVHNSQTPRLACEALKCSGVTTGNVIFATTNVINTAIGDTVYQMGPIGSIPIASSTTPREISGPGITSGDSIKPFLLVMTSSGVSTNTINAVNAFYN